MPYTKIPKVEKFFSVYRTHKYSKGQVLLMDGVKKLEHVFYLTKGRIKVYDVTYRGDEIILNVYKPNSFFPMSMAINESPNKYIYEAETDIELKQAPSKDVLEFIKENPDVLYDLLSRVYKGIDGVVGRMAQLMSGTAKNRVAYELVIEAKRTNINSKVVSRKIELNEKEIASRAGLSRETVSREMNKLKNEGIISMQEKLITITNIKKLQELLEKRLDLSQE